MNFLRRESPVDIQATRNLMRQQAMIDNAPVGSVGAPGGLLGMASPQRGPNYANSLLTAASAIPGVGDAIGFAQDAAMYATEPKSRNWINYLLTGLGALPAVPNLGTLVPVTGKFFRGGKMPLDGQFFSRDIDTAKGFAKGHFGEYAIDAPKALRFGETVTLDEVQGTLDAMRKGGDTKAADQIEQAMREDGGALSEHLYMWMERLGRQAPENYLKEGGIQAIDTGRDIKLFEPKRHAQLYKN